jgi:hypothetical protein
VAIVNWLLALGNSGAADNARRVFDRRRVEQARVELLLRRLTHSETRRPSAA